MNAPFHPIDDDWKGVRYLQDRRRRDLLDLMQSEVAAHFSAMVSLVNFSEGVEV